MSTNGKVEFAHLIPTVWSSLIYQELRHRVAYLNLCHRDYEGEIRNLGDKVKVNTIIAPEGEILTNDKASFNPEEFKTSQFEIEADRRAVASFEITDMAKLQSLEFQQEVINALVYSIQLQMEKDIQGIMIPKSDNRLTTLVGSSFDVADVVALRTLLRENLVPADENLYLSTSPTFYGSLMQKNMVVGADFGSVNDLMAGDVKKLAGFKTFEHDLEVGKVARAFHTSALQVVAQTEVNVKISDLHAQKKFGYLVSADIVYGRKLADNARIADLIVAP